MNLCSQPSRDACRASGSANQAGRQHDSFSQPRARRDLAALETNERVERLEALTKLGRMNAARPERRAEHLAALSKLGHKRIRLLSRPLGEACRVSGSSRSKTRNLPGENGP